MSAKGPTVGVFRQAAGAWLVLLSAWGIIGVLGLLWISGAVANWVAGVGLSGPRFGFRFAKQLVTEGPSNLWPDADPAVLWGTFALLLLAIGLPLLIIGLRWAANRPVAGDPLGSLASHRDLEALTPEGVRDRAFALRPALARRYGSPAARRKLPVDEAGVPLGTLKPSGTPLRASWEDVAVAIMAPRSGKTTAQAIPAILDAPGAVVATSNKADVWAATHSLRARKTGGRVWVFDPQGITHEPQTWWWNPLQDVDTYDAALRLARHFIQEVRQEGNDDFWISAATDLLTALLLAAGVSGGTLYDVYRWLNDSGDPEPVDRLVKRFGKADASAASLEARQGGAEETREGIYETARTACRVLRNPSIMAWVTPPESAPRRKGDDRPRRRLDRFDAAEFARTGRLLDPEPGARRSDAPVVPADTVYLLSKDGAAAAAPLVAALTDRILVEATNEAERRDRGRLDAPMVVVLDEAANICRISDLPALYSHLGSRGIFVLTILQSRPQARQVWGRDGFETMWSAATVKVVGAGIDDPELADDVSRLVGDHDVPVRSVTSSGSSHNESIALRKEAIMSASAVRAMPKGEALLMVTGARPASIGLTPWYASTRAAEVEAALRETSDRMQRNAAHSSEPESRPGDRRDGTGGGTDRGAPPADADATGPVPVLAVPRRPTVSEDAPAPPRPERVIDVTEATAGLGKGPRRRR